MAEWTIEPLTSSADIEAILAVEEASFTNPWTREMYRAELRKEGISYFFLARDGDRHVIGFCSFWRVADELHINNLAVMPGLRQRGVGSALLARVLDEAPALGAARAYLEVRRSNDAAKRLYERFGFTVAGTRREYYSQPVEDAIVLTRDRLGAEPPRHT
jgi:ribosomal-protein-alanine N-acetyltransferase